MLVQKHWFKTDKMPSLFWTQHNISYRLYSLQAIFSIFWRIVHIISIKAGDFFTQTVHFPTESYGCVSGSWGSWRTGQYAGGGSMRTGAVVILFIVVTTASAMLMEQYWLRNLCSVLLSWDWWSSSNPVYRGYYCSLVQGKAVRLTGIVLSTALEKLEEQY